MQETGVQPLTREDPTCCGAAKPVQHNYQACALVPREPQLQKLLATATKAQVPKAHALQKQKPL